METTACIRASTRQQQRAWVGHWPPACALQLRIHCAHRRGCNTSPNTTPTQDHPTTTDHPTTSPSATHGCATCAADHAYTDTDSNDANDVGTNTNAAGFTNPTNASNRRRRPDTTQHNPSPSSAPTGKLKDATANTANPSDARRGETTVAAATSSKGGTCTTKGETRRTRLSDGAENSTTTKWASLQVGGLSWMGFMEAIDIVDLAPPSPKTTPTPKQQLPMRKPTRPCIPVQPSSLPPPYLLATAPMPPAEPPPNRALDANGQIRRKRVRDAADFATFMDWGHDEEPTDNYTTPDDDLTDGTPTNPSSSSTDPMPQQANATMTGSPQPPTSGTHADERGPVDFKCKTKGCSYMQHTEPTTSKTHCCRCCTRGSYISFFAEGQQHYNNACVYE